MTSTYDVVVVGGGAAGLSAALALGRSRRSVLVVDAGAPRNAPAGHVHNYLGREGTPPRELLASGREEVATYGGEVRSGVVTDATGSSGDFRVTLADGTTVGARRLLVTAGLLDELPDVHGLAERWGRDVIHCPYCHGWEVRDQAIGILGSGPMSVHLTQMFRQLSDNVTLLMHTAPVLTEAEAEELAARRVRVVVGAVEAVEVGDDRLSGVRLASGRRIALDAVVVAPRFAASAGMLTALGVEASDFAVGGHVLGTHVAADPTGLTAVPGVYVAGNVTEPMATVIAAAAAGLRTGALINGDLIAEETRDAVAAHAAQRVA